MFLAVAMPLVELMVLLNAIAGQYLLKPVSYSKFISCLNGLLEKNNRQQRLS